ncbi:MAG: heparinase II/III-family protein [Lachnospiraceae bacterium]|nr:heparinase II/III-family protein [Lachnospiraceae bacterium]
MYAELWEKASKRKTLRIHSFAPYPALKDRSSWQALPKDVTKELISEAASLLPYTYPSLSAVDYMLFSRTGNRVDFESLYFERRRSLCTFVLAECAENKGRFTDDIINGIFCICEESGWQLPAHNSYLRDHPQELLPDAGSPVLDLFACETGALLAMILYVMEDQLSAFHPFVTKRIREELMRRIIRPYLTRHFWWMGRGKEPMCNWTTWCTQNVLLTAFNLDLTEKQQRDIIGKAAKSLDFFLKDYGVDGCCNEGPHYYRHAGLCLFGATEILNAVTGNVFAPVYKEQKIYNLASYIEYVHAFGPYYANFADSSPLSGKRGVLEYLFGKAIGNPSLVSFSAADFASMDLKEKLQHNDLNINLYLRLMNLFTYQEVLTEGKKQLQKEAAASKAPAKKASGASRHIFYPSIGLYIVRNDRYYLAVKGGCNGDSHNHNDTGSIILYKDGAPFLIDVGVGSYTKQTFSKDRYKIWTMQSAWHNLPSFGEIMEMDGSQYKAKLLSWDDHSITLDIAGAYPKEAGLASCIRKVTFPVKDGAPITVEDTCTYKSAAAMKANPLSLSLLFYDRVEAKQGVISLYPYEAAADTAKKASGKGRKAAPAPLGTVTFEEAVTITAKEREITDPRLMVAWKHPITRATIKPAVKGTKKGETTVTLRFSIE